MAQGEDARGDLLRAGRVLAQAEGMQLLVDEERLGLAGKRAFVLLPCDQETRPDASLNPDRARAGSRTRQARGQENGSPHQVMLLHHRFWL